MAPPHDSSPDGSDGDESSDERTARERADSTARTDADATDGGRPETHSVLAGRERRLAILVATLAGVSAVVVSTELFPYHSLNHDEGVYLNQAAMLLEGRLTIAPPVPEAFRPWFFVERPDGTLYPKYAPVPAATFAVGMLAGSARFALGGVAAGVTLLTYGVVSELFDRRRGLLAAVFLTLSPLFLLQTAVFLPYAPTTLWNLLFAYAYLRGDRLARRARRGDGAADPLGPRGWAAVAGTAVGVAFFSRPYTAVLFAAPFVAHATLTLRARGGTADDTSASSTLVGLVDRRASSRQTITATLGLAGVATALAYNATLTGSPTLFPYRAFAPLDGIGFGYREILGYGRAYTPRLGVRANAAVVAALFGRWVAGGPVGTLLALGGLVALARRVVRERPRLARLAASLPDRVRRVAGGANAPQSPDGTRATSETHSRDETRATSETRPSDEPPDAASVLAARAVTARRVTLAATFLTVIVGNVAFWGNLNVLGTLGTRDGLIAALGPYYHFDLLVPTAAFAADGATRLVRTVRRRLADELGGVSPARIGRVALVALLVGGLVVPSAGLAAAPVDRNADVTRTYESAYAVEPPDDAVVFLPTPLGDWLAHPYQAFRNDPTYDDGPVYALPDRQFAVADAFPDRRLYRYTYREPWQPLAGTPVTPHLQRVHVREGETVRLRLSLGVPNATERVAIRASDADDTATFAVSPDGRLPEAFSLDLRVAAQGDTATAAVDGPVTPVTGDELRLTGRTAITLRVFADTGTGAGVTYRIVLPLLVANGTVRALTPELEACERPQLCGGEAAYVPGASPGRIDATLVAVGNTTRLVPSGATDGRERHETTDQRDRRRVGVPA